MSDVEGDGNCFFRAVAKLLGDEAGYKDLREKAVAQLEQSRYLVGIPEEKREDYKNRMKQDGEWVDGRMIQALADAMSLRIEIHTNRGEQIVIEPSGGKSSQTIHLGYYVNLHYVSLFRKSASSGVQRELKTQGTGEPNDTDILDRSA